jgi:large conductance mechanosensitive channel
VLKEFREFAIKGNMIDLAIGVIVGTAFGNIVNSLVKDVVMPPIGLLAGRVDFTNMFVVMGQGNPQGPYATLEIAQKAGAVTLNLGLFINTLVNFVIVAFVLFFVVRTINRLKREEPVAPAAPPEEVKLLTEIRDLLRAK